MRELKFRAWDKVQEVMRDVMEIDFDAETINNSSDGLNVEITSDHAPFEDIVLMQFTGLRDKHGKEIYEGDIVDTGYRKGSVVWGGAEVDTNGEGHEEDWVTLETGYSFNGRPLDCYIVEVIGNIYENPELLSA